MSMTSPSKLDLTKPVQTRSGLKVRIICTDRVGNERPIVGLVTNSDGAEVIYQWMLDGTWITYKPEYDLVNVPVTVRVCLYKTVKLGAVTALVMDPKSVTEAYMRANYPDCSFHDILLDT